MSLRDTSRAEGTAAWEAVYAALRRDILSGALEGGTPLRQDEVAGNHGISKIPVREALRRLEMEGLVEFRPRRGAIVRQLSENDILELLDIRIGLECRALELAIPKMVDADLSLARDLLDEYAESTTPESWSELNLRFHLSLYEPCGNHQLLSMIHEVEQRMGAFMRLRVTQVSGLERPHREHLKILDACMAGDRANAVVALHDHIETTQKEVAAFFWRKSLQRISKR